MLDFPRLLARGLLIHFLDPNAYCHRLAKQFGKHVIYRDICPIIPSTYKTQSIFAPDRPS
jgi:hypothetical protein